MSETACHISGIVKSFGPNKVLKEINLDLPAGMITVLMGANGAGTVSYTHQTLPTKA